MTRIMLYGIKLIFLVPILVGCDKFHNEKIVFGDETKLKQKIRNRNYKDFCTDFYNVDVDHHEIISSFVGDYKRTLSIVTKKSEKYLTDGIYVSQKENQDNELKNYFKNKLDQEKRGTEEREVAERMLEILNQPKTMNALFKTFSKYNAKDFIVNQSKDFHFTSINESHYNGQNRAFTKSLLKPLWDQGYRYLALEAFSSKDLNLNNRLYPVYESGFYFKETNLGNLVREAISIGYKLISYDMPQNQEMNQIESQNLRNKNQALKIFENTLKKDTIGKVLIHSGHDHQMEFSLNGKFEQMGYMLRQFAKKDILTVNQNAMIEMANDEKENDYYNYVKHNIEFNKPIVFANKAKKCLVDPVKYMGGIDIQVYHPITKYIGGRPNWMIDKNTRQFSLPKAIREKYNGYFISVRFINEPENSTPIDQMVINDENKLILPKGDFKISIIDCEDYLRATILTTVL